MTPDELWLRTICLNNGLAITDIQLSQLSRYRALLAEWNAKINLISRKDEERIWDTHILLSLSFLIMLRFPEKARVLDLGTGGGLPGIPLAIMLPGCSFTLLDSIRKKITAVEAMIGELGLSNAEALNARAEEINPLPRHRNIYDIVTARSVSELANLLKWGMPFLKKPAEAGETMKKTLGVRERPEHLDRPSLVSLKGMEIETELTAARKAYPRVTIESRPLVFRGSESLANTDKQLIIAHL